MTMLRVMHAQELERAEAHVHKPARLIVQRATVPVTRARARAGMH
jgi:hypothetical protein